MKTAISSFKRKNIANHNIDSTRTATDDDDLNLSDDPNEEVNYAVPVKQKKSTTSSIKITKIGLNAAKK